MPPPEAAELPLSVLLSIRPYPDVLLKIAPPLVPAELPLRVLLEISTNGPSA